MLDYLLFLSLLHTKYIYRHMYCFCVVTDSWIMKEHIEPAKNTNDPPFTQTRNLVLIMYKLYYKTVYWNQTTTTADSCFVFKDSSAIYIGKFFKADMYIYIYQYYGQVFSRKGLSIANYFLQSGKLLQWADI